VDILGVPTGDCGQACHRVPVDADQAAGLAYPTTLLQVLQDREGLLLREFAAVQRCTLALREALLTSATGQDPAFLVGPVAETNPQVASAALAVVGAVRVQTAEGFQVVHDTTSPYLRCREKVDRSWT
jgi:hypothetical protein